MSKSITVSAPKSKEYEHPSFNLGATVFYKDWNGNWHIAEFVEDNSPKGWGFTTIRYEFDYQPIVKSVPFCCLYDLDAYLDQDQEYQEFVNATDDTDAAYDDWKDEIAIHKTAS